MTLNIDSDGSYLVAPGAKIRIAGYYYLSSTLLSPIPPLNDPIYVE